MNHTKVDIILDKENPNYVGNKKQVKINGERVWATINNVSVEDGAFNEITLTIHGAELNIRTNEEPEFNPEKYDVHQLVDDKGIVERIYSRKRELE